MKLFSLIFLVFGEVITMVYSAPKLKFLSQDYSKNNENNYDMDSKRLLDDSSSSDDYLSNDQILSYLRERDDDGSDEPETDSAIEAVEGYIFNSKMCKEVDDRILCGYEKNTGVIEGNKAVNMGNNCIERNDRIECGYFRRINKLKFPIDTIPIDNDSTKEQKPPKRHPKEGLKLALDFIVTNTPKSIIDNNTDTQGIVSNNSSSSSVTTVTTMKDSDATLLPSTISISTVENINTDKTESPTPSTSTSVGGLKDESMHIENRIYSAENIVTDMLHNVNNNTMSENLINNEKPLIEPLQPTPSTSVSGFEPTEHLNSSDSFTTVTSVKDSDATILTSTIAISTVTNVTTDKTETQTPSTSVDELKHAKHIETMTLTENLKIPKIPTVHDVDNITSSQEQRNIENPLIKPTIPIENFSLPFPVTDIKDTPTTSLPISILNMMKRDKNNTDVACIEADDRIVCYNYEHTEGS